MAYLGETKYQNIFFGRRKIFTSAPEITADNVLTELNEALSYHFENLAEIDYLYMYRRGMQPVLQRKKEIRPEICNKVVVNTADQIVVFKNGYFLTKPTFYVSRKEEDVITEKVSRLNEYIYTSGKQTADNEVVDWFHTVGVGALFVEPNREDDEAKPVSAFALDPRSAFVVYSLEPGNEPVMGVKMVINGKRTIFDVYTKREIFRLEGGAESDSLGQMYGYKPETGIATRLVSVETNRVGEIPIIEYMYNRNRMCAFESVLTLMDEYNAIESNVQDGIDQFIQSLIVTYNCKFEDGVDGNYIRSRGLVKLKSTSDNKADIKILSEQLDQTQTQVALENIYTQILEKAGCPGTSRNARSTSDNVGAVYLRSGWAMAETMALNCEDLFRESNRRFDRVFLRIVSMKTGLELGLNDFDICFTRNTMDNLLVKTQAALGMKQLGLAPQIALERSGLSNDPLKDIEVSKPYMDKAWSPEVVESADKNAEIIDETRVEEDEAVS